MVNQPNKGERKRKSGINAGNYDQQLEELVRLLNGLKDTNAELVKEKEKFKSERTALEQEIESLKSKITAPELTVWEQKIEKLKSEETALERRIDGVKYKITRVERGLKKFMVTSLSSPLFLFYGYE
ncbi:hypothetical protein SLEP1_g10192 [Rubroshorea leprosula]|uniref:Uncharacterized protein n=1 Tax=Rubroshorea leprosula TaxID=152421 RepID=A0AAV5ID72_9ROSI|nr:hypothetical protein SLEP1_g10192 [Rubroshorea leprosula]